MSASSVDLQTTLSNILQYLGELDRKIDRVDRKIDLLFSQSTQPWPNDMQGVHNPFPAGDIDWNSSSFDQTPLKPAGKTLDPIVTSPCMITTIPSGLEVWQGGLSQFEEPKPLGFSNDPYALQSDLVSSSAILEDFPPLSPRKLSAPMMGVHDTWVDQELPQALPPPDPLPQVPPGCGAGGYNEYDGGSFDENHNNFTSNECNDRSLAQRWANASIQEAESSAGSTAARPEDGGNNVQPESSSSASQRSAREKEKRRNRKREQEECLSRICDAKGIVWTGDKLSVLQNIIVKMGWTIPEKGRPNGKGISKDKACTACFEELKKQVGLFGERAELKILERVLAWASNGGREPPEASGPRQIVFSLG